MLYELRKISMEHWFFIISFILIIILSFLLGYTVFRYAKVELCKTAVEIGDFSL